jgi:hypothetical protein
MEWDVASGAYAAYTWTKGASETPRYASEIAVAFTNDSGAGGCDHNLYVQKIVLNGAVTFLSTDTARVIYDRGGYFDGADLIPGTDGMAWTGALRFLVGPALGLARRACPGSTWAASSLFCIEKGDRSTTATLDGAINLCRDAGYRLCDFEELRYAYVNRTALGVTFTSPKIYWSGTYDYYPAGNCNANSLGTAALSDALRADNGSLEWNCASNPGLYTKCCSDR